MMRYRNRTTKKGSYQAVYQRIQSIQENAQWLSQDDEGGCVSSYWNLDGVLYEINSYTNGKIEFKDVETGGGLHT